MSLRPQLTYANVVATLALCVAVVLSATACSQATDDSNSRVVDPVTTGTSTSTVTAVTTATSTTAPPPTQPASTLPLNTIPPPPLEGLPASATGAATRRATMTASRTAPRV